MRILRLIVLALVIVMTSAWGSASRPVEIRAVWMDKGSIPKTEQGIRQLVRDYAKAGINLLHPEVIFNGYAAYKSSYLPQKDLWNGVDMLAILIDEAHKRKMEVHPWVWVFRAGYVSDKGGILPSHPDWAMIDKEGRDLANDSYWLDPCNAAVRKTLLGAYRELAEKYPIDGIQLDYIRFPSPDFGYNADCREKFKAEYGIDPMDIQPFTKPVVDWQLWRENLINSFVEDVHREMLWAGTGRDIKVSAAVASFPERARMSFLQDWEYWTANRLVDFIAPMDYTADLVDFMNRVEDSAKKINQQALIAPGIGLINQKGTDAMLGQIDVARMQPVQGVTLFATAYLDKPRLEALKSGPFSKKAELPFRRPEEAAKKLLDSAKGRLKANASLADVTEAASEIEDANKILQHRMYEMLGLNRVQLPPPMFIPDKVIPIPEAQVPKTSAPTIDGKLDDSAWQSATRISLDYTNLGYDAPQPTEVYLARDDSNLYVAYRCHERHLDGLKATVAEHDGPVFDEDSVEAFFDVQGKGKDYYHFAMNSLGTKYESHEYDEAYNPEWQAAAVKEADAWTAEMAIPFSALKAGPSGAWRANFTRNRAVTPTLENTCWSPTYGSFHTPSRFGRLTF